jgi:hypothetical protein
VWSTESHLYLRENAAQPQSPLGGKGECVVPADACTVQLDAGLGEPIFQTGNRDTSKVFFTEGGDLYEYDVERGERLPLTKGAGVLGAVLGASEDGSYVYFVANGVLAGNRNTSGEVAAPNANNLYVLHNGGSGWAATFIAVLSGRDSPDWARGQSENLQQLTARVSPNGRWLAFMSQRKLERSYDNRDAVSGKPDEEVYLYDAEAEHLVCASCNPTGARPVGREYKQLGLVHGFAIWESTTWLAANIPGWTPYSTGRALHQSRYLSDSGRLFFNSGDALVPQDVNGTEDVYQYEPLGVPKGSPYECAKESSTFSERSGGCVGLVSSGTSPEESAFLDASESGGDVFFLTAERLTPQDFDTSLDVYDAHECTAQSPCFAVPPPPPPPCVTEAACKAAPSPQPEIFGAGPSETFSGAGNVAPVSKPAVTPKKCKKVLVRKRSRCVVVKHRAKHVKRTRRTAKKGRHHSK